MELRPFYLHALASRMTMIVAKVMLALVLVNCSTRPSRLYVLSSQANSSSVSRDGSEVRAEGNISARSPNAGKNGDEHRFGVTVTVPEYLDRLDVVRRTSENVLQPNYNVQWGEGLAVTATRALAEDLAGLLPFADFMSMPSRTRQMIDFQIHLDLDRFESEANGVSVLVGRWTVTDSAGNERASGRVSRNEPLEKKNDSEAMAAAMSRNLWTVSVEIAEVCRQL